MPIQRIRDKTNDLKEFYKKQGTLGKFFFPRALKRAIEGEKSSLEIADAAFKSTWFFHRWLFYPTGLNKFFDDEIIKAAQWLFNPLGIPKNQIGLKTGEGLEALERDLIKPEADGTNKIVTEIKALTDYYNSFNPLFRYFFPTSLKRLLDPTNGTPNQNISIIQAVYRDTYFYHRFLFPSVYRRFFNSEAIQDAYNRINDRTFPEGTLRVARNIKTLQALKKESTTTPTVSKAINITDIDEAVASIICSLNIPSTDKSNLNAQKMLEAIRTIQSTRSDGTLQTASHALYLYFQDKPHQHEVYALSELTPEEFAILKSSLNNEVDKINHAEDYKDIAFINSEIETIKEALKSLPEGNTILTKLIEQNHDHKTFNNIVQAFSKTGETSEIYSHLKTSPILNNRGPMTRQNILKIIAIKQKGWALEILRVMQETGLMSDDFTQENFNQITTYHDLNALNKALETLRDNKRLNQETFNIITVKDGNPIDLADRIITPLEVPMPQAEIEEEINQLVKTDTSVKPAVKTVPAKTAPKQSSLLSDTINMATNVYNYFMTPIQPPVDASLEPRITAEEPLILTEAERAAEAALPRPNLQENHNINQYSINSRMQAVINNDHSADDIPQTPPMETTYQRIIRLKRESALADPHRAERIHNSRTQPIQIIPNETLHVDVEPIVIVPGRRNIYQQPPKKPYEFNYDLVKQATQYALSSINRWAKIETGEKIEQTKLPNAITEVTVYRQQWHNIAAAVDLENPAQAAPAPEMIIENANPFQDEIQPNAIEEQLVLVNEAPAPGMENVMVVFNGNPIEEPQILFAYDFGLNRYIDSFLNSFPKIKAEQQNAQNVEVDEEIVANKRRRPATHPINPRLIITYIAAATIFVALADKNNNLGFAIAMYIALSQASNKNAYLNMKASITSNSFLRAPCATEEQINEQLNTTPPSHTPGS